MAGFILSYLSYFLPSLQPIAPLDGSHLLTKHALEGKQGLTNKAPEDERQGE